MSDAIQNLTTTSVPEALRSPEALLRARTLLLVLRLVLFTAPSVHSLTYPEPKVITPDAGDLRTAEYTPLPAREHIRLSQPCTSSAGRHAALAAAAMRMVRVPCTTQLQRSWLGIQPPLPNSLAIECARTNNAWKRETGQCRADGRHIGDSAEVMEKLAGLFGYTSVHIGIVIRSYSCQILPLAETNHHWIINSLHLLWALAKFSSRLDHKLLA